MDAKQSLGEPRLLISRDALLHTAAADLARIAVSPNKRARVQIMLDTGMCRTGVCAADLDHLLNTIASHAALRLIALGTHFSEAERMNSRFTAAQLDRFRSATD